MGWPMKLKLYDGKYEIEFSEKAHRYKVNGEIVPGVTGMLKLLSKGDSLMQWAVNCAIEAIEAGESPADAKYAYLRKRDTAGDVGKRVHAWIETYTTTGREETYQPDMEAAISAYLKWEKDNDIKHIDSERVVFSEQYRYAGTVDDIHESQGKRVVNDYKTGNPDFEYKNKRYTGQVRPRIEHLLQCALYDQAILEETGQGADRYAVTYITKDGKLYYFFTERVKELRDLATSVVDVYKLLTDETFKNNYRRYEWNTQLNV